MSTAATNTTVSLDDASFLFRPIDQGRVVLLNEHSKGSFGTIYTALGPANPVSFKTRDYPYIPTAGHLQRVYAVKELPRAKSKAFAKEIMCHRIMGQSPGILRLHHVVEEPDASYLVMDFHPAGDLTTSISTNFHIYEDSRYVKDLSLQIISAIEQCHSKGVYHRDIKPDNILIADGGVRVVVADFGLATNKESTVDFHNGSEIYMSPECLGELHCNNPYRSAPSDVWSLGVVVFCIFMGHPPWMKPSTTDIAFNSFLLDPDYFLRHFPISIQFHRLLRGVFTVNPERRPTLPQFAAALASMDPDHITYRGAGLRHCLRETRARYLRPIQFELIMAHVEEQLGELLNVEQFFRARASDTWGPTADPKRRLSLGDVDFPEHILKGEPKPRPMGPSASLVSGPHKALKRWMSFRLPVFGAGVGGRQQAEDQHQHQRQQQQEDYHQGQHLHNHHENYHTAPPAVEPIANGGAQAVGPRGELRAGMVVVGNPGNGPTTNLDHYEDQDEDEDPDDEIPTPDPGRRDELLPQPDIIMCDPSPPMDASPLFTPNTSGHRHHHPHHGHGAQNGLGLDLDMGPGSPIVAMTTTVAHSQEQNKPPYGARSRKNSLVEYVRPSLPGGAPNVQVAPAVVGFSPVHADGAGTLPVPGPSDDLLGTRMNSVSHLYDVARAAGV